MKMIAEHCDQYQISPELSGQTHFDLPLAATRLIPDKRSSRMLSAAPCLDANTGLLSTIHGKGAFSSPPQGDRLWVIGARSLIESTGECQNLRMNLFNMCDFHAELDQQRRARGLSWTQLAKEVNRPFESTPSIPISPGTLRDMRKKRSVTSAVVLQVLRWLGRTPESFLSGPTRSASPDEQLPDAGQDQILRLDTRAIYGALQQERLRRGLTWQQVVDELPGFTPSMLTNLASGPLIGFPRVMTITQWLGRPTAAFVRVRSR